MRNSGFWPGLAFGLVLATLAAAPASAQKVLKIDPPPASMATGTSVLVDDGSCPKGQIKKLTRIVGQRPSGRLSQKRMRSAAEIA